MTTEISMYIVWAIIVAIAFIIEINTQEQIGYAACASGVVAIIVHAITKGNPIWIEIFIFFISWVLFWISLFLFFKRNGRRMHDKEDGYLAYIGKTVKAIKANEEDEYGELKFSSKIFRFTCDKKIKKGDLITIKKIEGVTFIVEKATKKEK